jgi:hypothetical protein
LKFSKIAKKCIEAFNFSSAFAICEGLQDITVRNLPAWQHVPSKAVQNLEKVASFKVFVFFNLILNQLFNRILINLNIYLTAFVSKRAVLHLQNVQVNQYANHTLNARVSAERAAERARQLSASQWSVEVGQARVSQRIAKL